MATIQLKLRRGTAAEWTAANPILAQGEPGWEIDTRQGKIGDGVTAWNSLPYGGLGGGGGGGAVSSVNGQTGTVVLTASDVGAAAASHTHVVSQITDFTEQVQDLLNSTLIAGTNVTKTYDDTAGTLTLAASGGGGGVTSVNGRTGAVTLTKADVTLSLVDNTSDMGKPISTATQNALTDLSDDIGLVNSAVATKSPVVDAYHNGTAWPTRPSVASPVTWWSTKYEAVNTPPPAGVVGDEWKYNPLADVTA